MYTDLDSGSPANPGTEDYMGLDSGSPVDPEVDKDMALDSRSPALAQTLARSASQL